MPSLSEAAGELGACRELASRLRGRYFGVLVGLIQEHNRPGPRPRDGRLQAAHKRIGLLESLLGTARAVIVAAGIARLAPRRREEIVLAVERMHQEHGVSYEEAAAQLGLCSRTLRDWRRQIEAGEGLEPKSRAPKNPHGKLPATLSQAITAYVSLFPKDSLAELYRRFIEHNRDLCAEHGHPDLSYGAFSRHSGRSKQDGQKSQRPVRRGRDAPENFPYRALALMDTTDITCFGFGLKLIPFMEAHSRQIFAHQLCEQGRAAQVEKVLGEGMQSCGGVLALRVDRGTPYLAELTQEAVGDRGAEMRVARAYQATDKAILERWFRTAKEALRDVLGCVDLRQGPGNLSWRKKLAKTIAGAVIAFYMRWCYPYIPQPHIDGHTPEERTQHRPDGSIDAIRQALDDQVQHHESKKAVATELHNYYGFRWSLKRWLKAVEQFSAEDLREAARRFDHILLRGCFQCNSRRNPKYLLAIIRTVAQASRERRVIDRKIQAQRAKSDAESQASVEEEHICIQNPEVALQHALDIAVAAFESGGFGLAQAQRRLDQALSGFSKAGADAYRLATDRVITLAQNDAVRSWLFENIERFRPPPSLLREDLQV